MMDEKIGLWIRELRHFNKTLHLVGSGMLPGIEKDVENMMPLLESIVEPIIADIGSGSGLPAIPYKILHPQAHVKLIERSTKKCTFLKHVIELLGMEGLELVEADPLITDIGRFDAVLARAFSPVSTLKKTVLRVLEENGRFYYLFTGGSLPEMGHQFVLSEVISRQCHGYVLNLAIFRHPPENAPA
jgi:16S rRNA (guanine(527)-N(7))-methyltransferase RsmG